MIQRKPILFPRFAASGFFNGLHQDGLKNTSCRRQGDDGVADALNVELRAREASERAFDSETNRIGEHRLNHGFKVADLVDIETAAMQPTFVSGSMSQPAQSGEFIITEKFYC